MTAKDLKNALLQEAVQGKLVPQIATEGNARDLLEEIRKERGESLPLASARKRSSATPSAGSNAARNARFAPITEDEIPFEIPENWCWCRLGEIGDFVRGSGIKRDETTNTGLPCVRYGEMYTTYKIKFSKTKSFTTKDVFVKCHKIHTNDILMALTGENKWDIALAATYEGTEELAMGGDLCKFTPINCDSLFLVYLINSPYGIEYKRNTSTGDIIVHTSTTKLGNLLIPLPPLAEQKRIVAAIEKFMPLIEEYGKKETELKAFNEQIGALTKKAILQEAVQGKLVPQIAAEGNAKDLLEEIRKERLSHGFANSYGICGGKGKKSKNSDLRSKSQIRVTEISEDEIPFDIPENWCWCRLGEIVPFGVCQNAEPQEINDEDWILDLEDIEKDSGKILSFKTKKEVDSKSTKHIFKKGFVLYSKLRPYLNKCVIAPKDGFCTSEILPLDFGDMIYNKYAQLYLMSPFFVDYTNSLSFGVKMPRLGTEDGRKALFPLPPLAEQKRIVAAIEKMLPLCEKLGV